MVGRCVFFTALSAWMFLFLFCLILNLLDFSCLGHVDDGSYFKQECDKFEGESLMHVIVIFVVFLAMCSSAARATMYSEYAEMGESEDILGFLNEELLIAWAEPQPEPIV